MNTTIQVAIYILITLRHIWRHVHVLCFPLPIQSISKWARQARRRTCKCVFTCVTQKSSFARKAKLEKDCFTWKKIKSMALSWEQLWCSLLLWLRKFAPTTRRSSQPWELGRGFNFKWLEESLLSIICPQYISISKLIARKTISTTAFLLATSAQRDRNVWMSVWDIV